MFSLVPTSRNGELPGVDKIIVDWLVLLVFVVYLLCRNKYIKSNIIIGLLIQIFLIVDTLIILSIDPSSRVSIARIAPIMIPCILFVNKINISVRIGYLIMLFEMLLFLIIIWNVGILLGVPFIEDLTVQNYTQLYSHATKSAVLMRKPVFTFSIHSFASFFYTSFFFICLKIFQTTDLKRFRYYQILIIAFNILLFSNTSFFLSFLMIAVFIMSSKNKSLTISSLIILSIFFVAYVLTSLDMDLLEKYFYILNNDKNGFLGRYIDDENTLSGNFEYIKNNYFIGYTIIGGTELTYTDSGYALFYTMGGGTLVVLMYTALLLFLKHNLPKVDFYTITGLIALFEIALPLVIYYKFSFYIILVVVFYQNLDRSSILKENNRLGI